ncbi:MAG: hybrid sensor histidine kinase/response regulator [bacterium]
MLKYPAACDGSARDRATGGPGAVAQKILVVDDKPRNRESLVRLLAGDGVQVLTAGSGNEALGLMLEQDLALVLLDVQMPEMDGYEVATWMRRHERTRHLPIIFVTAINKEPRHIATGYEAGAVDYLFKPVDPTTIRAKVNVFLALNRHQAEKDRLLAELGDANRKLREATRRKSDFLAAASHELRTPLTVIREFCSLVHDGILGDVNAEQKSCLGSVLRNCDRLGGLVNGLLDLDGIESGSQRIARAPVDAGALVTTVQADFLPRCLASGQRIVLDVPQGLPPVLADPDLVTQVLVNLVGNAHKFTPAGGCITLALKASGDAVRIEVRDTGCGIATEDHAKVFEKFTQLHRKDRPGPQGTGLGLAISRRIIELHGGAIGLDSEVGEGSVFWIELPVHTDEGQLAALLGDASLSASGYGGPWTLVLLRSPWVETDLAAETAGWLPSLLRQGEDHSVPLKIADRNNLGILLKTGRDGALAFLARLEQAVAARRCDRVLALEFALCDVTPEDPDVEGILNRPWRFMALDLGLETGGTEDVQEEDPGR